MIKRRIGKTSDAYSEYDRVGLEIPQLPHISKLVVSPMKVVFINQCADPDMHIDRMFRTVEDFAEFCEAVGIDLP